MSPLWTALLVLSSSAQAHSLDALSVRLHTLEQGEVVEVIAPSATVQHALEQGDSPVRLDSKAGKERWVAYLKQTLDLDAASGPITLGGGGIRVDSHQVVVRLQAQRASGELYPLQVNAPVLAEQGHQPIVSFRVVGDQPVRTVLQAGHYQATLSPAEAVPSAEQAHAHAHAHGHEHAH